MLGFFGFAQAADPFQNRSSAATSAYQGFFGRGSNHNSQVYVVGTRVEVERYPGHWQNALVIEVDSYGWISVQYDDGVAQHGVPPSSVRTAETPFKFLPDPAYQSQPSAYLNPDESRLSQGRRGSLGGQQIFNFQQQQQQPPALSKTSSAYVRASPEKAVGHSNPQPLPPKLPSPHRPDKDSSNVSSRSTSAGARTPLPPPPPPFPIGRPDTKESSNSGRPDYHQADLAAAPAPPPPPRRLSANRKATQEAMRRPPSLCETDEGDQALCEEEEEPCLEAWEQGSVAEAARKRLSAAISSRRVEDLSAALSEAQKLGLLCREVRKARDMLIALEHPDLERRTATLVEEAVQADDWWRLQATMQEVVGGNFDKLGYVQRLKDAMKMQRRRQHAVRQLHKAATARDPTQLRTALEGALLVHVKDSEVQNAREAIKALESRPNAKKKLQAATKGNSLTELRSAMTLALDLKLGQAVANLLPEDPDEKAALQAAKKRLEEVVAYRLRMHFRKDADNCLDDEQVVAMIDSVRPLLSQEQNEALVAQFGQGRDRLELSNKLKAAAEGGNLETLAAAIVQAETSDMPPKEDLESARKAMRALQVQADQKATQSAALDRVRQVAKGSDMNRLFDALAAAEAAGLGASDLAVGKDRLKALQLQNGSKLELIEARRSGDLYRLRAAVSAAERACLDDEEEMRRAKEALRSCECCVRARRVLDLAIAQADSDGLRRAIVEARHLGLPAEELRAVEGELQALRLADFRQELHDAISNQQEDRLRDLAVNAPKMGLDKEEVAEVWNALRRAEVHAQLRETLVDAVRKSDINLLRSAAAQAESEGLACRELDAARVELGKLLERGQVLRQLRTARYNNDFYATQAALAACDRIGVSREEVDGVLAQQPDGSPATVPDTNLRLSIDSLETPTNPHVPPTAGGSLLATNPRLQSMSQTFASSTCTVPQFNSFQTDPQIGASFAQLQTQGAPDPGPGLMRSCLPSQQCPQPRADEPPASMYDLNSCVELPLTTVGREHTRSLQL